MLAQEIAARWPGLRLREEIGHGAYGNVYKVLNTECSPPMEEALKVISIPLAEDGGNMGNSFYLSAAETLAREATILSDLSGNPYIVRYYDHAIIPRDSGVGYDILIRMELLTPFRRHMAEHGLMRQDVIKVGIDICRALELCRKRGVIHRDIKPENVFISDVGNYKLGDFGVAVNADKTLGGLSKKGTYSYMAPEVYRGADYGPSIDIYSLGMILYRLLNNDRDPFVPSAGDSNVTFEDTQRALARRMRGEALPCPVNEGGPLWDIVKKAASPLPEDRYRAPEEMRAELEALADPYDTKLLIFPAPEPPKVTSVALDPERTELQVGETAVLNATVAMTVGSYGGAVKWYSSDPSVMTVTANGPRSATVTCVGQGSCHISAEAGKFRQNCLYVGSDRGPAPAPRRLSNRLVAVIIAVIVIACVGALAFVLTQGNSGGQVENTSVSETDETVEAEVVSLGLDHETVELTEGESVTLTASVGMSEGDFSGTVQWTSSDTSVVQVESTGGLTAEVTCVGAGSCTVTAEADGCSARCSFDCAALIVAPSELTLDCETITLARGESVIVTAATDVEDWDGSVTWETSDEAVFTVTALTDTTAEVAWTGEGQGTVTAVAGDGVSATCAVTCEAPPDNTMKNLDDTGNSEALSLDGTTAKNKITEVYFLDTLEDAPSDAEDLSADGDGGVLCWTEGTTQYIAGEGGVTAGTECPELFRSYINLTVVHFSGNFDTSNVKNMRWMFYCCKNLTSVDISDWDTSNVTDMTAMFNQCQKLKLASQDLSGWDTSRVTTLEATFYYCSALTSLDLSGWDTSNVKNMHATFGDCRALTSLDLSGWDTSSVTNMTEMFLNCKSLTGFDPNWLDTSNADTTDMYTGTPMESSQNTSASSGGVLKSNWGFTDDSYSYDTEAISLDGVTTVGEVTKICFLDTLADAPASAADLSRDGDRSVLCWTKGSTQYIAGEGGVIGGNSCEGMLAGYVCLEEIDFSGNFDTSGVTNMSLMFYRCGMTKLDLSDWDTSNVKDMSEMFCLCTNLASLNLSGWDTSNVTNMYEMFYGCCALTDFNRDWLDTSNADTTEMYNLNPWE